MPIAYTTNKRLNEALAELECAGWQLLRRKRHLVFSSPDRRQALHIATTIPDRGHTANNYLSRIRKALQNT